jgi:predicted nuclease with TOPRIM domain
MAISERTNLEAHVDLCAERYRTLEKKLDTLEGRIDKIEEQIEDRMDKLEEHIIVIRTTLMNNNVKTPTNENATEKAQGTIITIGTAFGVALLTGLITTFIHLALK